MHSNDQYTALTNCDVVADDVIEICAGGQFGEYPAEVVCGADQANHAVALFSDGSEADLNWM